MSQFISMPKLKPKSHASIPAPPPQEQVISREPEPSVLNSGLTISELIKEFYRG
jgi:hypothetical protein